LHDEYDAKNFFKKFLASRMLTSTRKFFSYEKNFQV